MPTQLSSRLVMHGAIVVLLGLLVGFPYANVVLGTAEGEVRAFRMAHLEGVLNGLLMLAVAGVAGRIQLGERAARTLYVALLATGYGNVLAATLAAFSGSRGLEPGGPLSNWLVFGGFMVAVLGVLVAVALVVRGAWAAARGDAGHG